MNLDHTANVTVCWYCLEKRAAARSVGSVQLSLAAWAHRSDTTVAVGTPGALDAC